MEKAKQMRIDVGSALARALKLKKNSSGMYQLHQKWGTKTDQGLYLVVKRIIRDGESAKWGGNNG